MSTKRIKLTPLMKINTSGGDVLHGLKKNEDSFIGYGETYFSMIDYQSIKAWKMHLEMTLNLIVPIMQSILQLKFKKNFIKLIVN